MNAARLAQHEYAAHGQEGHLRDLHARVSVLMDLAITTERKAEVARIGMKLCELMSAMRSDVLPERDASTLPRLAVWLDSKVAFLESQHRPEIRVLRLVTAREEPRAVA